MKLEKLNAWLTLVANLGVIAGIVFLGLEIRQTHELMRAQTRNELSKSIVDLLNIPSNNLQVASVIHRASKGEQLTPEEYIQFEHRSSALYRYWENVHYQYRQGLYDEIEFQHQKKAWKDYFSRVKTGVEIWNSIRLSYSPEFREEIDNLLPKENKEGETKRSP